jgi:O-antigen ligase
VSIATAPLPPVNLQPPPVPRPPSTRAPIAYYLALVAIAVNILDAWVYPKANYAAGGIKIPRGLPEPVTLLGGLRVADALCLFSLILSLFSLCGRKYKVPACVSIPLALASWAFLQGLLVGLAAHHSTKVLFGECHILLYFAPVALAWLQTRPEVIARQEKILYPIAFIGMLVLLPSSSATRGGDISTIAAGMAAIALIRYRARYSIPFAILAAIVVITGGQRAALLFSLPPMIVAGILAWRRHGVTRRAAIGCALAVAGIGLVLVATANSVSAFIAHEQNATFTRTAKVESASSRQEQWSIAVHQISEAPGFGRGLAYQYQLFDPPTKTIAVTDLTHNIYLDLTLRLGLVGAAILASILVLGVIKMYQDRARLTNLHATIILVLIGLLAKGAVESILDKPRLMLFAAWVTATLLVIPTKKLATRITAAR